MEILSNIAELILMHRVASGILALFIVYYMLKNTELGRKTNDLFIKGGRWMDLASLVTLVVLLQLSCFIEEATSVVFVVLYGFYCGFTIVLVNNRYNTPGRAARKKIRGM